MEYDLCARYGILISASLVCGILNLQAYFVLTSTLVRLFVKKINSNEIRFPIESASRG